MVKELDEYTLADGKVVSFPKGTPASQVNDYVLKNHPESLKDEPDPGFSGPPPSDVLSDFFAGESSGNEGPGFFERMTDSASAEFGRVQQGIVPGIKAGYSTLMGDQEGADEAHAAIDEANARAHKSNPNKPTTDTVMDAYNEVGLGEAIGETGDFIADNIGSVAGQMAPWVAAAGVGYVSAAAAPVAIAAAGIHTFLNLFSNQIERSEHDGEVSVEDMSLLTVAGSAAGQAVLERVGVKGLGLIMQPAMRQAAKAGSPAFTAAMNTQRAVMAKEAMGARLGASAQAFGKSIAIETGTELGQTALERAAAGETISPTEAEAMDEYNEIFWATIAGVGPFGANSARHRYNQPKRAQASIDSEESAKAAAVEGAKKAKAARERQLLEESGRVEHQRTLLQAEAEESLRIINDAEVTRMEREAQGTAAIDRTMDDIRNLAADRGIDIDSSPEAEAGFLRMVKEVTGTRNPTSAEDMENIYRRLARTNTVDPDLGVVRKYALTGQRETNSIARRISRKFSEPMSKAKMLGAIKAELKKDNAGFRVKEHHLNPQAMEILDRMELQGLLLKDGIGKRAKYTAELEHLHFLEDPEVQPAVRALLDEATRTVRVGKTAKGVEFDIAGQFPTMSEARNLVPGMQDGDYKAVTKALQARGVLKVKGKRFVLQEIPDVLSDRVEFARSEKPVDKWIVRGLKGDVAKIAKNKKEATEFHKANANTTLAPFREKGWAIRRSEFEDQDGGDSRYLRSEQIEFIRSDGNNIGTVDGRIDKLREEHKRQRNEYLGSQGDRIESDFDPDFVQRVRSKDPQEIAAAIQDGIQTPFAPERVVERYPIDGELEVDALESATDRSQVQGADRITIGMNINGTQSDKQTHLSVPEGHVTPDGKGFGRRRIESRFPDWAVRIEKLGSDIANLKVKDRFGPKSKFQTFAVDAGRVWLTDGSGPDGIHYVLDYMEKPNAKGQLEGEWSLYNMFTGQDLANEQAEDLDQGNGFAAKHGDDATADDVRVLNNPEAENVRRFTAAQRTAMQHNPDLGSGALRVSPKAPYRSAATWVDEMTNKWVGRSNQFFGTDFKKGAAGRMYAKVVDGFAPVGRADRQIVDQDGRALNSEASAIGSAREHHRMTDMAMEATYRGTVQIERVTDKNGMEVETYVIEDHEMLTAADDMEVFDPVSGEFVLTSFVDEGASRPGRSATGGMSTVINELPPSKVDKLKNFFVARRELGFIRKNLELKTKSTDRDKHHVTMLTQEQINDYMTVDPDEDADLMVAIANIDALNAKNVNMLVDSGVIDSDTAQIWLEHSDYIPFFRDLSGAKGANAKRIAAMENELIRAGKYKTALGPMQDRDPAKRLKGGAKLEADDTIHEALLDPLGAMVDNSIASIVASSINKTRRMVIRNEKVLGNAEIYHRSKHGDGKGNVVDVRINGEKKKYFIHDPAIFESLEADWGNPVRRYLETTDFAKLITTTPPKVIREMVTRNPGFAITNSIRDASLAYMINPDFNLSDIGKILTRASRNVANDMRGRSDKIHNTTELLAGQGVTGGAFNVNKAHSGHEAMEKLKRRNKSATGNPGKYGVAGKVWDAMGRYSTYGESATREQVFENAYLREMENLERDQQYDTRDFETIARQRALHQSKEVLNFDTRGSSTALHLVTSLAPFINARIQGVDLALRVAMRRGDAGFNSNITPDQRQAAFIRRGMTMAAISIMIQAMNMGDEEYEREPGWSRDNNWYAKLPGGAFFKMPIPFEVGFVFKTIPEQLFRLAMMTGTGDTGIALEDAKRAMIGLGDSVHPGQLTPVIARPFADRLSNTSGATGIPIESYWEQSLPSSMRVNERTTAQARAIGQVTGGLNYGPKFVDNTVRVMGGTLGMSMWTALDHILRMPARWSDDWPVPVRPIERLDKQLVIKRFLSQGMGSGMANQMYEFREDLEEAAAIVQDAAIPADRASLSKQYRKELQARNRLRPIINQVARVRKQMREVRRNPGNKLTESQMRAKLDRLQQQMFKLEEKFKKQRQSFYRNK
jgi:hypothetical protein